ncbi:SdpI family protein [Flagellimonas flava]|uniref:SdpI/YhfL protein family protein n=1 Tax=Flagellimonas flava TaxID=570519 RepID=A0A1M5K697_9FLAO|nr:SdpI family protein [Allomuricauda flava]SHG48342.1 SdpI/YhfL protein family protein [Allomuricauda flava]
MTINALILLPSILAGAMTFIGGLIFKRNPPKKINWWYGYRTKRSMENQEKWDFAQKIGAENMMKYSLIPFLTSILGFLIDQQHIGLSIVIVILSALAWAFFSIYRTEAKLKSEFDHKEE